MPKRKKHERLPNAYGSIRYLGKNRKNPYAVHPPCKDISEEGDYVRPQKRSATSMTGMWALRS